MEKLNVVGVLAGDIHKKAGDQVKYGFFFEALERATNLLDVHDASLKGVHRILNALMVYHPNPHTWRERFYKNVPAFKKRSTLTTTALMQLHADVVVQVGTLLDACWSGKGLPSVIYTDYTARLSAQKPDAGRSPLSADQREEWFRLEKQAFDNAQFIFTRGNFVRKSVMQDYGIPAHKVMAVGGGVNFAQLPDLMRSKPEHPPTLLFIGKEFQRKGGDLLLQAWQQVRASVPNAHLMMVTELPEGVTVPDGVEIITPTWDRDFIQDLYWKSDGFVLPSRLETWGDVLLEAMAYGLPCIGVSGEAMDEIILHEQTGLIVPPLDANALAQAAIRLLGNTRLQWRWGAAARQRVTQHYTWERVVQKMLPILSRVALQNQTEEAATLSLPHYELRQLVQQTDPPSLG